MDLRIGDLDDDQIYKLLISCVVPRPIAWITTLSSGGLVNLAPFSAFTFVSEKPPMLAVSIGHRDGTDKDTARNVLDTGEFVINVADFALAGVVQASSRAFAPDVSEVEQLGLATRPSRTVATPGIEAAPISLECRLRHCLEFGDECSKLIVGEVLGVHVRDGLLSKGRIDTGQLNPLARVAGPNFAKIGQIVAASPV